MKDKDFENPANGHLWGIEVNLGRNTAGKTTFLPRDTRELIIRNTLYSPFNLWRDYANAENEYKKQEAKDAYNAKIRELDNLGYQHPFQLIVEN